MHFFFRWILRCPYYMYVYIYTYTYVCVYVLDAFPAVSSACMYARIRTYIIYTQIRMHMHIIYNRYIHTYTHTYIHTQTTIGFGNYSVDSDCFPGVIILVVQVHACLCMYAYVEILFVHMRAYSCVL